MRVLPLALGLQSFTINLVSSDKTKMVVFDFDGTIADTLWVNINAYNKLAPKYGARTIAPTDLGGPQKFELPRAHEEAGDQALGAAVLFASGSPSC